MWRRGLGSREMARSRQNAPKKHEKGFESKVVPALGPPQLHVLSRTMHMRTKLIEAQNNYKRENCQMKSHNPTTTPAPITNRPTPQHPFPKQGGCTKLSESEKRGINAACAPHVQDSLTNALHFSTFGEHNTSRIGIRNGRGLTKIPMRLKAGKNKQNGERGDAKYETNAPRISSITQHSILF